MSLEFLGIEDLFAYGIDCSFSLSLSLLPTSYSIRMKRRQVKSIEKMVR